MLEYFVPYVNEYFPFFIVKINKAHPLATRIANSKFFSWIPTGLPFGYSNWAPGEPNHAMIKDEVEHCVEINYEGKWNDKACLNTESFFVCEYY